MTYQTLLVDGPWLSHKAHAAPFQLTTSTNLDAIVIPTFLRSLLACYNRYEPDETIITWESHGTPSWRRAANPNYKPKQSPDYNFISQVKDLQNLLKLLGIKQYYSPTNEADDVIATLCKPGTLIYSVDKDLMQLVNANSTGQYDGKKLYFTQDVVEKFGVMPHLIPDLLALMGDASDNITGIKGWGLKKSSKLIARYGQVEDWFTGKERPSITDNEYFQVIKNKQLTTLNHKCELVELTFDTNNSIKSILDKYELKKLKESIDDYKVFKKESVDDWF